MNPDSIAINPRFHGWRIVAFSFFSQFVAMGFSIYILGIYIQPMAASFDVSPGKLGWGMAFFYLANSLAGPFVGNWVDQGKARLVMLSGSVVFALGFIVLGLSTQLWQAALACLFLLAPGACMLGVLPCATLLVRWFRRRQGFAVGVAAIGVSVGGFVMPPLANLLIESLGWRHSMFVLGAAIIVTLVPYGWLVIVGKPEDIGQRTDGDPAPAPGAPSSPVEQATVSTSWLLKHRTFWLLTGSVGLLSASSIVVVTFIVPFAIATGVESGTAALLISLYAGSAVLGKVAFGWAGDRMSRRRVMIAIQCVATFGWLFMVFFDGAVPMMASASLVGLAIGGTTPMWAALIAHYYGPETFGRVKGVMTLAMLGFLIVPGPLGGYLYDLTGSYASGFAIIWWALPVALLCTVLLPEREAGA